MVKIEKVKVMINYAKFSNFAHKQHK